jgi:hypothetical protein
VGVDEFEKNRKKKRFLRKAKVKPKINKKLNCVSM